jgi:hypothetical protein
MSWFTKLFGGGAVEPAVAIPDPIDIKIQELRNRAEAGEITLEDCDRKIAVLTIDDEYELEQALEDIRLRNDPVEGQIVEVKRKFAAGDLTENERDKEIANIRKEPYVNVIEMGIEGDDIRQGFFELDWNDEFVIMLQNAGITGTSDDDVVNKWFNGVCRTVLLQEGADLDYGLEKENDVQDS